MSDTLTFEDHLGRGSSAEVWLARDASNRPRAVKFFNGDDPDVRERVALEHASALMRVHHPGVVRIYDVRRLPHPDLAEPRLAIVMEYVEGVTLSNHQELLPLEHAILAAEVLTDGLQAIHNANLVHDDLHAGNVMITGNSAKLLDILYTQSLADVGTGTRTSSIAQDLRGLATVLRELFQKTAGLDDRDLAEAYYFATTQAALPHEVLSYFRATWSSGAVGPATNLVRRSAVHPALPNVGYLVLARLDRRGAKHVTHVVANAKIVTSLPGVLLANEIGLMRVAPKRRPLRIFREDLLERRFELDIGADASHFRRVWISDPALTFSHDGANWKHWTSISDPVPEADSSEPYFVFDRAVYVTGVVGDLLFVEQRDYWYGGGAHGNTTCSSWVLDTSSRRRHASIFTEDERREWLQQEGSVAGRALDTPTADELGANLDDRAFGLDIVATWPLLEYGGLNELRLRCVCAVVSPYATSDNRWSSYTRCEEVTSRRLPGLLTAHAKVPFELTQGLRDVDGEVIGWSEFRRGGVAHSAVASLLTSRTSP